MNEHIQGTSIAEFMQRRGRTVVECGGVLWHSVSWRFYMSIPYEKMLDPDRVELGRMLQSRMGLGARFPSLVWPGLEAGAYFCRRKNYELRTVHVKHRPRVVRGLERFEIRRVEHDELLKQGLELNLDTMKRQERYDSEFGTPSKWRRVVDAMRHSPAIVPYGAFRDGRLAAYMITACEPKSVHILHQMSRQSDLADFPNHALTFCVTKELLSQPEMESVCYGFTSLVNIAGLHEYKLRFGYQVDPFHCSFVLHPLLRRTVANAPVRSVLHRVRSWIPGDQRLERMESVLEGARLSRPEILATP
jgi:hypothetical protein